MTVIPAIIPENLEDLESHLVQVRGLAKYVQIDVCDGKLTPSSSWPYIEDYGDFDEMLKQEKGMPFWEDFDFEIDLMVLNPAEEYEKWIDVGASRIVFHYNTRNALVLKEIIQKTKDRGVEAGIALHIDTPTDVIEEFKDSIDFTQFMGIKNVGFQGEPFEDVVLERIKEAKERYPLIPITVDGGVDIDTAPLIVAAGASRLVVGSGLFNSSDIKESFEEYLNISL